MAITALSLAEVEERVGVKSGGLAAYLRRPGAFPDPDVVVGVSSSRPVRGWMPETIDAWNASRRGQEWRALSRGCRSDGQLDQVGHPRADAVVGG